MSRQRTWRAHVRGGNEGELLIERGHICILGEGDVEEAQGLSRGARIVALNHAMLGVREEGSQRPASCVSGPVPTQSRLQPLGSGVLRARALGEGGHGPVTSTRKPRAEPETTVQATAALST